MAGKGTRVIVDAIGLLHELFVNLFTIIFYDVKVHLG